MIVEQIGLKVAKQLRQPAVLVERHHFVGAPDAVEDVHVARRGSGRWWVAMIAVAGLDMAVPLCVLLGGSIGPVPAYNSNGLWLKSPAEVAKEAVELGGEGGFRGLKLRLGRERLDSEFQPLGRCR